MTCDFDIPWEPESAEGEDWGVVQWKPQDSREPVAEEELRELCAQLIEKLHFRARADVCVLFHKICLTAAETGPPDRRSIEAVIDWSAEDLNGYCDEVCRHS